MAIDFTDPDNEDLLARNGTSVFSSMLKTIENNLDGIGYKLTNPSNPLFLLMEGVSITHADVVLSQYASLKKIYPKMATTRRELYHSLTDDEFKDIFATASDGTIVLGLLLDEVKQVAVTTTSNLKIATIPEGTIFTVSDTQFMLPRQILIRILNNGGIQVIYGESSLSDQYNFESNLIDYNVESFRTSDNIVFKILRLTIDVKQLSIITAQETASATAGFSKEYPITNQFTFCKIYSMNNDRWVQMATTHSNINYDINVATALIRTYDNSVKITIPDIYFTKGLISTTILVEIYTTKGNYTLKLGEYTEGTTIQVGLPIGVYQNTYQKTAVGVLKSLKTKIVAGIGTTSHGYDTLSFSDLKTKHLNQTVSRSIPVTNVQIEKSLSVYGFDITLAEDILTKRLFLAKKAFPTNTGNNYSPKATTTMGTLTNSFNSLKKNGYVIDNGKRLTIQPSALFKIDTKTITIQDEHVVEPLKTYSANEIINFFSSGVYGVSPFYNVVDVTGTTTVYRTYQLDRPEITNRLFLNSDDTSEIIIGTKTASIEFSEPDYKIYLVSKINGDYNKDTEKLITARLEFTTADGSYTGYIQGSRGEVNSNGECIWIFNFETHLDIDKNNYLGLQNVKLTNGSTQDTIINLSESINILYQLPNEDGGYKTITHEIMDVTFGKYLDKLYNKTHVIKSSTPYETYTNNVYDVYADDVYEMDAELQVPKFTMDEDGLPVFNILHKKGDIVKDDNGNEIILHYKGDFKKDSEGNYIPLGETELEFSIDLLMINAIFKYASYQPDVAYYSSLSDTMVSYMDDYIDLIRKELIGLTNIQYYPEINISDVKVQGSNNETLIISGALGFEITISLTEEKFSSTTYREEIKTTIIDLINTALSSRSISISGLTRTLLVSLSDEVLGITIASNDLSSNVPVYRLINDTESFTIGYKLERQSNDTAKIVPNLTFNWVK